MYSQNKRVTIENCSYLFFFVVINMMIIKQMCIIIGNYYTLGTTENFMIVILAFLGSSFLGYYYVSNLKIKFWIGIKYLIRIQILTLGVGLAFGHFPIFESFNLLFFSGAIIISFVFSIELMTFILLEKFNGERKRYYIRA